MTTYRSLAMALLVAAGLSRAETGMALIVKIDKVTTTYKTIWDDGPIMRIDLNNDQIASQVALSNSGFHARFSLNGDKFAFLQRDNHVATIADLNGNVLTTFTYFATSNLWPSDAFSQKSLTWTQKGIYIWGKGRVVLFSESGARIDSFTVTDSTGKVAGISGRVASNADWAVCEEDDMIVNVATRKALRKVAGDGCGWGISPDGTHITQNRWDTFAPHATMGIWTNNGGVTTSQYIFHMDSLLGLTKTPPGYVWNLHKWSGNNNDIFVMTVGPQQTQQGQIGTIGAPYICNYKTRYFKNLRGSLPENVVYTITDFYQGKVPGGTTATVSVPTLSPAGGSFPGTSAEVTIGCATTDATLYYTTNGSDPSPTNGTVSSPGSKITLTLSATPLVLKVVAVKAGTPSAIVSGTYTGQVLNAAETPADTAAGLTFRYYRKPFTGLPDFDTLQYDSSGTLSQVSVAPFANTAFGLVLEGYLYVPADSVYTFSLSSNDGARLYIAGQLVIDNDGSRTTSQVKTGSIGLAKGLHAIKIVYFNQANDSQKLLALSLNYSAIAANSLFHSKTIPFQVLSPDGGESYAVGSTMVIRWTAPVEVTQVVISLSIDGGLSFPYMITGTGTVSRTSAAWGNYAWQVPADLDGQSVCTNGALVHIANYQGDGADDSDSPFSLGDCSPARAVLRGATEGHRLAVRDGRLLLNGSDGRRVVDILTPAGVTVRSITFHGHGTAELRDLRPGSYLAHLRGIGSAGVTVRFVVF